MPPVRHILSGKLPDRQIKSVIGDVKVHAPATTSTALRAVDPFLFGSLDITSFWVETLIKIETNLFRPPIPEMILSKGPKLDIAFVA